ncbi:hypothetical protein SAMN05421821_11962 [Mucilaginibacter lappiensis]|uniref:RiboL-PSP-HEPN domain-containing protein n=1 Tax=Mucilaginibacter lappiensis TaxID=354630 RepID=A0ABR6PRW4_9SPHI|nr:hypothetical protein [Mucilaginibacter lappiensis]MBB6112527.1 hypothetical protein [Mucilaginibacter lappiensis]SIS02739.1 hypothetical protein SAMN05421821_11962 [Mucilaginibacter lappiensis]
MELNQIEKSFKQAISELNRINGRLYVLNSFVTQTKDRIEKESSISHELMTSGLAFRDITLDKEAESNLFMSTDYYRLHRLNLNDEVDMIISRESLFQVSQAYEIVESFLYSLVAELIRLKSSLQLFVNTNTNSSTFASIRKALKGFGERKNNRHLLSILRANASVFREFEKENIYDLDFEQWYEMLSEVRHCVTHSRSVVTPEIKKALPKCFNDFFEIKKYGEEEVIFVNESNGREIISRIADYIFLVYKAVAELCYETEINFHSIVPILNPE